MRAQILRRAAENNRIRVMNDVIIYIAVFFGPPLILLGFDQEISAILLQNLENKSLHVRKTYNQLIKYWWINKKFRNNTIIILLLIYTNIANISFIYFEYVIKLAIAVLLVLVLLFNVIKRFEILKNDTIPAS